MTEPGFATEGNIQDVQDKRPETTQIQATLNKNRIEKESTDTVAKKWNTPRGPYSDIWFYSVPLPGARQNWGKEIIPTVAQIIGNQRHWGTYKPLILGPN